MRLLAITYRFGREFLGGAENYLYRLLRELVARGVEVEVATTTAGEIREIGQWGAQWGRQFDPGTEILDRIRVHRFPTEAKVIYSWWFQYTVNRTVGRLGEVIMPADSYPEPDTIRGDRIVLGNGWHFPERNARGDFRWSRMRCDLHLGDEAVERSSGASRLVFDACSIGSSMPGAVQDGAGRELASFRLKSKSARYSYALPSPLPKRFVFDFPHRGATKEDPRWLSACFESIRIERDGAPDLAIDFREDWRTISRLDPESRVRREMTRTEHIDEYADKLFTEVRGPRSKKLEEFAMREASNFDVVLGHAMPQATIDLAARAAAAAQKPLALLPLAHLEDPYYHWPFFTRALKQAKWVFTPSAFEAAMYRDLFQARAFEIGAGIDIPASSPSSLEEPKEFKAVFVGRKSPTKNYTDFVNAMEILSESVKCRGVMIGPDADGERIDSEVVEYLGALERAELEREVASSDALVFPSRSESFGMAILDAWAFKKPALVSRWCGATASVVEHGVDGFHCGDAADFAARLGQLAADPALAGRMGDAGFAKAREKYNWAAVADRFLESVRSE